ncbi:MAG TPA: NADH-quinone oxidoreductase subunit NuoE [Phycisphaerales bacterium]|nr:NADH-quinone oxidoreductase subunit NuoE [Phycisphaerales bacterium]
MAWITKNSGTARIERRAEPYLSEKVKAHITSTYFPRYETRQGALLPTLHAVQAEVGWLPHQALIEIAAFLGLTPADVIDTASFYEEYWLRPKGKRVVWVCRSIACEFCGHRDILNACRQTLGVEPGETTDDEEFTLMEIECLGSCGTAPVALIDHTLHENLTPRSMQQALHDARADKGGHAGH